MSVLHVVPLTTPCRHKALQLSQSCNTHTHNEHSHTHSHTPCLMVCECVNAENLYKLSFPSHSSRHPSTGPCVSLVLGPARRLQLYCLNTHAFLQNVQRCKNLRPYQTRQNRVCVVFSMSRMSGRVHWDEHRTVFMNAAASLRY